MTDLSGEVQSGEVIIYATWTLPTNTTSILQVWQEGPVASGTPQGHATDAANLNAQGTLDLLSGQTTSSGGASSTRKKKNVSNFVDLQYFSVVGYVSSTFH